MADTGIFATTLEVQRKAGANASSVSNVEAYINDYMTQAESYINAATRKNWSDAYSVLNADVKGILKDAASCLAAIMVLNWDLSGLRLAEVQTRCNILSDRAQQCINILKEIENQKFIVGA